MKGSLRLLLDDNLIRISVFSSLILLFLQIALVLIIFSKLPPLIPFLNSQPWGIQRLYPSYILFLVPVFLAIVFVLNNILSAYFYQKNTLISRILSFNSLLFIFLALMAYIQIVFLVF